MKRGPINIPDENFRRTIEYLEGCSAHDTLIAQGKFSMRIHYLISWLNRAYKFDSIADFEVNRKKLPEISPVIFENPLTVVHRDDINNTEIVGLSDESGRIELRYPYTLHPDEMFPDTCNNPIHGADIGDKIKVYSSMYKGGNRIEVAAPYFVSNDAHYERIRKMREEITEEFKQQTSH